LKQNNRDWNDLAEFDPLWAILSDPSKRFNKWDKKEFFETGKSEVDDIIAKSKKLGFPKNFHYALDFGCGVGRLAKALSNYFDVCYGVDISENMIKLANQYNQNNSKCKFVVNSDNELSMFTDNFFDFIYTNIVLQHIPDKDSIKSYIIEFIRILNENGILIFQLPNYISLKYRLQPRRRLYSILKHLGFSKRFLYYELKLTPIIMNFIPENEIVDFLRKMNVKLLNTESNSFHNNKVLWKTYFVSKQ